MPDYIITPIDWGKPTERYQVRHVASGMAWEFTDYEEAASLRVWRDNQEWVITASPQGKGDA